MLVSHGLHHLFGYHHYDKQSRSNMRFLENTLMKLLGLKKGASKEEVLKAANQLQKKIHPDMNRNVDSSRLSQLVNEAKEKILKTDFS